MAKMLTGLINSASSAVQDSQQTVVTTVSKTVSERDQEDIYAQLAQKEHDLTLAAELGKALLEKNEDLKRQNEVMEEEYADRLEVRAAVFDSTLCLTSVNAEKFRLMNILSVTVH